MVLNETIQQTVKQLIEIIQQSEKASVLSNKSIPYCFNTVYILHTVFVSLAFNNI